MLVIKVVNDLQIFIGLELENIPKNSVWGISSAG